MPGSAASPTLGTALTSEIGYEKTAVLVNEAHAIGRTIRDLAREKSGIPEERLSSLLCQVQAVDCRWIDWPDPRSSPLVRPVT
jgi:fumarate hydratase class II